MQLLPRETRDRESWATDIQSAFQLLDVPPSTENLCAVLAVTEQESTFTADPVVPGLAKIARSEIDRRAAERGIPQMLVRTALLINRVGATESAVRSLGGRIGMGDAAIRRALEQGGRFEFERTDLHERVFALAERMERRPLPRAVMPDIDLHSPKFTRKLTTRWFATRVEQRYRRCVAKAFAGKS